MKYLFNLAQIFGSFWLLVYATDTIQRVFGYIFLGFGLTSIVTLIIIGLISVSRNDE